MQTTSAPVVFNFTDHSVRIVTDDHDNPWFAASDICNVLGYANSRQAVQKNCKLEGVSIRDTPTSSGIQPLTFINEGNLYRLIVKSRKPEAEKFEAWLMDEVLPSIRKTGGYAASPAPTSPTMADALGIYRDSVQALLLTQPMQQAHTLACKSASRATGIDLEALWAAPPAASLPLYLPGPGGTVRIARPVAEVKAKILRVVKEARRYRAAAYYGLTRQGVMPYGYALTLCKVPSDQFRQLIDEMLAAGSIRQAPPDIYMGGMMCFVAGGAA